MVEGEVTVVNDAGLHLRPAGVLTKTAVQWCSKGSEAPCDV